MRRLTLVTAALAALLTMSCGTADGACDPLADADFDGLDDCIEQEEYGTDPQSHDSDFDGFSDGEEVACGSNPLDVDEECYACGWRHDDPGDLVSTGSDIGDVIENIPFIDQCGEQVQLWDFAREYHILFLTASW